MSLPVTEITSYVKPAIAILRTYGEPRFYADGDIAAIAFAADGTLFSIDETGYLRHWTAEGSLLSRVELSDLETLWCFAPGAKQLASGNDDLLFWDTATGQLRHRIEQSSWLTAIAYSPDCATVATGHDDGKIRLWNTSTYQCTGEIAAHKMPLSTIAFSPDGKQIATAGEDRVVRVWDAVSHDRLAELRSHTDRIPSLSWSADGTLLASAGWDTSARVWDPKQADPLMLLNSHSDQVLTLAFAPRGSLLATVDSDHDIHLWSNPKTAKIAHVLRGHVDEIHSLSFNADGSRLASAGADRVIHIWDTATGRLVAGPNPTGKHGIALITGPNDTLQLISTGRATAMAWDAASGAEIALNDVATASCLATSRDGRWLAIGGTDHFTRLHDRTNPGKIKRLEATKPPIGALSFNADGTQLAQSSPADGLVWLWDTATGEPNIILIEAADGCTLESIDFHPDGQRVAVGGIDYLSTGERTGAVCVWDVPSKTKQLVFDTGVYILATDPTGRYLAGAGINDAVYVWDLESKVEGEEEIFELAGHTERIQALAFSPDGSYLISGGDDMTIRIWDILSGRLLTAREFDTAIQSLAFSPCGKWLFTGNGNTTCYQIEFAKLVDD